MTDRTIISFDDLAAGTKVSDQYADKGVTITSSAKNPAMIFDATQDPRGPVSGRDYDLLNADAGGILIASEDGDSSDPDDEAHGATLGFSFDEDVTFNGITLADVEEGAIVSIYDAEGRVLYCEFFSSKDGEYLDIAVDVPGAREMYVEIKGSGGVDDLVYTRSALPDGVVNGTAGADLIDATYVDPQGDVIDGDDAIGVEGTFGDADLVLAGDGDDTVLSGEGDDIVRGGAGDDEIDGGTGNDTLEGGTGDDTVQGGSGDDLIDGGDGDDILRGGGGNDTVLGGTGDDSVSGSANDDVLDGGDGDDTISGSGGDDTASGGAGNDDIRGGKGDDLIDGGDGSDTISGGDGDDTVQGGSGDDLIDGGDGDDILRGGGGNDTVRGGAGDDSVSGSANDDVLEGGDGDDTVSGSGGNDTASGGAGDDDIRGGKGDDLIDGGEGSDKVSGGDGDDTIDSGTVGRPDLGYPGLFTGDADPLDDRDTVSGGDGDDVIRTGDDDDLVSGGAGDDRIDGGFDRDTISGDDGDDFLVGGEGSDEISGGDGDDTIYGGLDPRFPDQLNIVNVDEDGDVVDLVTDNGRDLIDGGDGDDLIFGQDDDDTILGGDGDDTIDGGIDDDSIDGGDGDDVLTGGQGNDVLTGGDGADMIGGGADRDLIVGATSGDMIDGGSEGDDQDTLDLRGTDFERIDYTSDDREDGIVTFRDGTTAKFEEIETVIPCFTPGTLIATPLGEVPVENLSVGDRVVTRDGGIQTIRWVGRRDLTVADQLARPALRGVRIREGALGHGLPERDMIVSPQHRILIVGDEALLYFEEREVLVAAKHLVGRPGIERLEARDLSYIHLMFDAHQVILSDGAWTESFQPGDGSLAGLEDDQREELFAIFPELRSETGREGYLAARRALRRREALLLR